jgi:hypothetical protein
MNDQELDDILNTWRTPAPLPGFRERIRAGFRPPSRRWFALRPRTFAVAAALGAVALLFFVPRADPQPAPAIPWTVDSEFIRYADGGSSSVEMLMTSWMQGGNETVLSRSDPSNPLTTAMWQAADAIGPAHDRIVSSLFFDQAKLERIHKSRAERAARTVGAVTGCEAHCLAVNHFYFERAQSGAGTPCVASPLVGRDTILGHPTVAFRQRWTEHGRNTVWMAPDLGCIALRSLYEGEEPDGSFKMVSEKRAVRINGRR